MLGAGSKHSWQNYQFECTMNAPFKMMKVLTERGVVVDKKAKQSKPKLLIRKITLNCMYLCLAATSSLGIGMCTILVSDSHAHSMYFFAH